MGGNRWVAPIGKVGGTDWSASPSHPVAAIDGLQIGGWHQLEIDRWVAPIGVLIDGIPIGAEYQSVGGTNWSDSSSHPIAAIDGLQVGGWHQLEKWVAPIGVLWLAPIGKVGGTNWRLNSLPCESEFARGFQDGQAKRCPERLRSKNVWLSRSPRGFSQPICRLPALDRLCLPHHHQQTPRQVQPICRR